MTMIISVHKKKALAFLLVLIVWWGSPVTSDIFIPTHLDSSFCTPDKQNYSLKQSDCFLCTIINIQYTVAYYSKDYL